ncbi:putative holin-like toxin [Lacticaseibacillus sp. 53-4]|nr:putative holin-like toxin [Lacticaseibacillus sp. 53-4]
MISVADAISMMIEFGGFIVGLLTLVIVIVKAMTDDKKNDRR